MATFTIEELNKALNGALIQKGVTSLFSGISTDTRTIKKGDVFIALLGENFSVRRDGFAGKADRSPRRGTGKAFV